MLRNLLVLLRSIVAAALLAFVLAYYGTGRVFGLLGQLNFGWLALGMALTVGHIFIVAWRWRLFCLALTGVAPDFARLASGSARSLLFGPLLPATVGADVVRAATLASAIGSANAVRSVLSDRILGLLALLLLVAVELPILSPQLPSGAGASLAVVAFLGIAALVALPALRRRLRNFPVVGALLGTVADDLYCTLTGAPGQLGFAAGFGAHLMSLIVFVAVAHSVDPAISIQVSALVILPALLVVMAPISLSGWGVREAAIATGFSLLGADPAPAVTASVLFGFLGPLSGAAVELWRLLSYSLGVVKSSAP